MADKFDPYREALVMETATVWPPEFSGYDPVERARMEALLHASPEQAEQLEYVRVHTGFCRTIHVTQADLDRVMQAS